MKRERSQQSHPYPLPPLMLSSYRGDKRSAGAGSSGPRDKLGSQMPTTGTREPWGIASGAHTRRDGSVGTWPHLLVASELEILKLQSGLCSRV